MSSGTSPFDASQSALGYLHQCRYALLLALQRDDDPSLSVSIEKLDDVAFHGCATSPDDARELLQIKHHVRRAGGLGDSSPDIWKTVRVWSEAVKNKQIDLDRVTLCLVTTSSPTNRNAMRFLSPDPQLRNPQDGRAKLEQAGTGSNNEVVKKACAVYMALPEAKRKKLFDAIYLLHGSPLATDLPSAIGRAVRHAVEPRHRRAFVERLEGWWLHRVAVHLIDGTSPHIPVLAIQQQVHELRGQFQRDCLPEDVLSKPVPPEATADADDRVFVVQLALIELSTPRLRIAQEDHYRAFTQRSRWVKDNLIALQELTNFEGRLVDEWRLRFHIMQDGVEPGCDGPMLARHGMNLYQWVETNAPSQSALWVRPQFQSQYMTRGSYHLLADALRVGWHPEFERRLAPSPGDSRKEQP